MFVRIFTATVVGRVIHHFEILTLLGERFVCILTEVNSCCEDLLFELLTLAIKSIAFSRTVGEIVVTLWVTTDAETCFIYQCF